MTNDARELGRQPIAGRFGIPDAVVHDYIAAFDRVSRETHTCGHLLADHRNPQSYFPYSTETGLLCSLCSCGWD